MKWLLSFINYQEIIFHQYFKSIQLFILRQSILVFVIINIRVNFVLAQ